MPAIDLLKAFADDDTPTTGGTPPLFDGCSRCGHPYEAHIVPPKHFDEDRIVPRTGFTDSLTRCLARGGYETEL